MKIILFTVFALLFVSVVSYVDARDFSPFHFRLADEIMYDDLWFYVDGIKPNFKVDKGETATFPIVITSKHAIGTTVDFHATIGNDQMGKIRFPPGANIHLEPNQMILNGQNQTLNVTVQVSERAPSSKYNVNLVGVWKEEGKISDFMGTGFSLHVGKDFGNDAVPVNFLEPPLKFSREGVEPKDIPCRNDLILILKYDGTPACVREETKPRLIERGWMKTEVNVHNAETFIEGTKKMDSVQYFLSLYPDAEISIDKEWYTITYAKSGFIEQDPNRSNPTRTKNLIINLDYDGKLAPHIMQCGGPVSSSVHDMESLLEHLHNPDWCFPHDQSQFDSDGNLIRDIAEKRSPVNVPDVTSENDMYCDTNWNIITENKLDSAHVKQSTQSTIAQFGGTYFLEERIIDVFKIPGGYAVSISGLWDRESIQYRMISQDLEKFGTIQGEPASCQ